MMEQLKNLIKNVTTTTTYGDGTYGIPWSNTPYQTGTGTAPFNSVVTTTAGDTSGQWYQVDTNTNTITDTIPVMTGFDTHDIIDHKILKQFAKRKDGDKFILGLIKNDRLAIVVSSNEIYAYADRFCNCEPIRDFFKKYMKEFYDKYEVLFT